jgi:hypothetical protein
VAKETIHVVYLKHRKRGSNVFNKYFAENYRFKS